MCHAPPPWSIADFAADAAGLIEAVCEPPVAVVGLSMGALIGQQLALDRPELLRCVVAMGTAARSIGLLDRLDAGGGAAASRGQDDRGHVRAHPQRGLPLSRLSHRGRGEVGEDQAGA